jgi:hypothetical protein
MGAGFFPTSKVMSYFLGAVLIVRLAEADPNSDCSPDAVNKIIEATETISPKAKPTAITNRPPLSNTVSTAVAAIR